MKKIPQLGVILVCLMILNMAGCSPNASIKELAQYSYSDNESRFIADVGAGSEMMYFKSDNTQYHYRIYKGGGYETDTRNYKAYIFGFMFKDEKLSAIAEDGTLFVECHELNPHTQWDNCFTNALQKLEEIKYQSPSIDFSDAIEAEENVEGFVTFSSLLLGASHIVLWPIAIITDPININKNVQAHNCVEDLFAKVNSIYLHENNINAVTEFDQLLPDIITSTSDQSLGNRRLIQRIWHCDSTPEKGFYEIEILAGFVDDKFSWIYIKLRPECCSKWKLDFSHQADK